MESKKVNTKQTNDLMQIAVKNISNDIWRDFFVAGTEIIGKVPIKHREGFAIVKITVTRDTDELEEACLDELPELFNNGE